MNAAIYGLVTCHFFTAAMVLLISTVMFLFQGRLEVVLTAPMGAFTWYVGIQAWRRFAMAVRGEDRFGL
jgi:hypothetical protein